MPGDSLREAAAEVMARAAYESRADGSMTWASLRVREKAGSDVWLKDFDVALTAFLTLLDERGFVVVPKVATEDMLAVPHSPLLVLGNASNSRVEQWRAGIYKAMLAASPNPFAEEPPHG